MIDMSRKQTYILFLIFFFQIFLHVYIQGQEPSKANISPTGICPSCTFSGPVAYFCNLDVIDDFCVDGNAQVNGDLTVCGTINGSTNSNYAFSYLSVQLPFSQPNFWTDVLFDTNGPLSGWTHQLGSPSFVCDVAGIYCIGYDAVTQSEGTSVTVTVELGVVINGILLPESTTATTHTLIDQPQSAGRSFLKQVNVGDDLRVQLRYMPNGRADLVPPIDGSSIALTIFRVG